MKPSTIRASIRHGLLTKRLLRILERAGLKIDPFLITRELHDEIADPPRAEGFTVSRLERSDIPALLPVETQDAAEVERRLDNDMVCYVARDGERVVAKTWCDLREFSFPAWTRPSGRR